MPTFYNFRQNGVDYSFDDIFVPAEMFRDGNLWTWGNGNVGRLGTNATTDRSTPVTTFTGGTNWKQISSGDAHTAAIKTDGTLWVWGNGVYGRLGTAATTNVSTPVTTFAGGTDWKQVSSGYRHTAAIKTDGTLWTWGNGVYGRLGTAVTTSLSTPVTTFAGGTNWKQVSTGFTHTAAIKTDGTLWTWGNGNVGRLGTNDTTNRSTPVTTFTGGSSWKQVSGGITHTAAIKTDGTLWIWGNGSQGQLGRILQRTDRSTPVTTFAGGTNWADTATTNPEDLYTLSAAITHTVAIKTDGTLWTWGNGTDGKLGTSVTTNVSTPVTTFAGGTNWKQVSGGSGHTAAIKTDGTLWTWGNGTSGRLGTAVTTNILTPVTTFAGGTNWKQISSASSHTAAVKTDGTLWTWGNGVFGQLGTNDETTRSTPVTTFAGGTNWKQISSGTQHTSAIKTDGTLWTWGRGSEGQLGRLLFTYKSTPVITFAGGTNWADTATTNPEDLYTLSAGTSHTAAIKTDGTLWIWGSGFAGRLGNGVILPTTNVSTPVTTFAGGTDWKQVSSGNQHTSAIKTDGTLWTWGNGVFGQLGTNAITNVSTPVTTFTGGTNWKQVSIGNNFTAAIKTDGTLWTWGYGGYGQLGAGNIGPYGGFIVSATPVTTFAGGTNWKQVSTGKEHTAAIKTDGTLWTWGRGDFGRLGINDITLRDTPVTTFAGGTNWKQVSSGDAHTAAVKTDGTLWTWGYGFAGRLGNANTTHISTPITTFAGGTDWKQVSSGNQHTSAIKTDGTLWTWGNGSDGKLGTSVTTNVSTPVTTFAGGTNWKQVSGGGGHTIALKDDGVNKELYVFGNNSSLQLGTLSLFGNYVPNQTFAGGTNWKQVSSGTNHTAAVKTDGTLWTWGNGSDGKLGTSVTTNVSTPVTTFAGGTNWKQVSSGTNHTAAVKTDGTLWTWGYGFAGQLGNSATTLVSTPVTTFAGGTNWKQISSGSSHTIALKDDGVNKELYVFGTNSNGQLGTLVLIDTYSPDSDLIPVTTFAGGTNWKQVSTGFTHTAAIKTDGTLWTWGNGTSGRLGTAVTTNIPTPVTTFAGGTNWKQVSSGNTHTAAIKTDGTLWTWGNGAIGQLGTSVTTNVSTPVTTFAGGSSWKQVSSGREHTAATTYDDPVI